MTTPRRGASLLGDPCPYLLAPCDPGAAPLQTGRAPSSAPGCCLTSVMVARLQEADAGRSVLHLFWVGAGDTGWDLVCGPDEMLIVPQWCMSSRRAGQCEPSFRRVLALHGVDTSLPAEAAPAAA